MGPVIGLGGWLMDASLERNAVKSLQRPIQVGEVGEPDCWVIG
jgi:hypothetical protein